MGSNQGDGVTRLDRIRAAVLNSGYLPSPSKNLSTPQTDNGTPVSAMGNGEREGITQFRLAKAALFSSQMGSPGPSPSSGVDSLPSASGIVAPSQEPTQFRQARAALSSTGAISWNTRQQAQENFQVPPEKNNLSAVTNSSTQFKQAKAALITSVLFGSSPPVSLKVGSPEQQHSGGTTPSGGATTSQFRQAKEALKNSVLDSAAPTTPPATNPGSTQKTMGGGSQFHQAKEALKSSVQTRHSLKYPVKEEATHSAARESGSQFHQAKEALLSSTQMLASMKSLSQGRTEQAAVLEGRQETLSGDSATQFQQAKEALRLLEAQLRASSMGRDVAHTKQWESIQKRGTLAPEKGDEEHHGSRTSSGLENQTQFQMAKAALMFWGEKLKEQVKASPGSPLAPTATKAAAAAAAAYAAAAAAEGGSAQGSQFREALAALALWQKQMEDSKGRYRDWPQKHAQQLQGKGKPKRESLERQEEMDVQSSVSTTGSGISREPDGSSIESTSGSPGNKEQGPGEGMPDAGTSSQFRDALAALLSGALGEGQQAPLSAGSMPGRLRTRGEPQKGGLGILGGTRSLRSTVPAHLDVTSTEDELKRSSSAREGSGFLCEYEARDQALQGVKETAGALEALTNAVSDSRPAGERRSQSASAEDGAAAVSRLFSRLSGSTSTASARSEASSSFPLATHGERPLQEEDNGERPIQEDDNGEARASGEWVDAEEHEGNSERSEDAVDWVHSLLGNASLEGGCSGCPTAEGPHDTEQGVDAMQVLVDDLVARALPLEGEVEAATSTMGAGSSASEPSTCPAGEEVVSIAQKERHDHEQGPCGGSCAEVCISEGGTSSQAVQAEESLQRLRAKMEQLKGVESCLKTQVSLISGTATGPGTAVEMSKAEEVREPGSAAGHPTLLLSKQPWPLPPKASSVTPDTPARALHNEKENEIVPLQADGSQMSVQSTFGSRDSVSTDRLAELKRVTRRRSLGSLPRAACSKTAIGRSGAAAPYERPSVRGGDLVLARQRGWLGHR